MYINREDFFDTGPDGDIKPPKGYKRLTPGGTVRLKYAYVLQCEGVVRDSREGDRADVQLRLRPGRRLPEAPRKPRHRTVGVCQAPLGRCHFMTDSFHPEPGKEQEDGDFLKDLNPKSRELHSGMMVEESLTTLRLGPLSSSNE